LKTSKIDCGEHPGSKNIQRPGNEIDYNTAYTCKYEETKEIQCV
jgi:hypothetical protein